MADEKGTIRVNCCKYTDEVCIFRRLAVLLTVFFPTKGVIAALQFKIFGCSAQSLGVGEGIVEAKLCEGAFG